MYFCFTWFKVKILHREPKRIRTCRSQLLFYLFGIAGLYNQVHIDTGSRWPDLNRYHCFDRGHLRTRQNLKKKKKMQDSGQIDENEKKYNKAFFSKPVFFPLCFVLGGFQ